FLFQGLEPVDAWGQHALDRTDVIIGRVGAFRVETLGDRLDCFKKLSPRRNYRLVGLAQVLLASIDDRPHRLLHRTVLLVDPFNAGIRIIFLNAAVYSPAVGLAVLQARPEAVLVVDKGWSVAPKRLVSLLLVQGLAQAVIPVPHHAVLVVDRHRHVATKLRLRAAVVGELLNRPDLMMGKDVVVRADVVALFVLQRAD